MISNVTNNLPGHVFVDAYDAHDDTSYLLDANFNVIIIRPNSKKQGFLEQLFSDSKDHDEFSRIARILVFPVYFRFIDPGETGFMGTPLTPEFLNEQRADREPMWRRWLAHDIEGLRLWWINTPSHAPKTLKELSMSYSAIPKEFNVSKNFAQKLRKVAGIGGF